MNKFEEAMETYKASGVAVDSVLLEKVAKSLGPSIYNADSSLVSSSDKSELETVKQNFMVKKLGLHEGPELDKALNEAIDTMGRSNPKKHRAVLYTLLVKKFNKEHLFQ